jgi:porin
MNMRPSHRWRQAALAMTFWLAFGIHPGAAAEQERAVAGGPWADTGTRLTDRGITPRLALLQFFQANPGTGVDTGNRQVLSLVTVGADLDLARIAGLDGATIHVEQMFVPIISNLNYRAQLGDALSAIGAPYLPKHNHLQTFTYEQKLLDGKFTIEVGKSNAIYYFASGLCNLLLSCQDTILVTAGGFNPFPYANWSGRLAYDLSPRLRLQAGAWRSNPNFFNQNGWERSGDRGDPISTSYLANLVYRTTFAHDAYPATYELMGYYNNARQNDRIITAARTAGAQTHEGTAGLHLAARKVVYRPDGGSGGGLHPSALSIYGMATHAFDPSVGNGIRKLVHVGLIEQGLFKSRPLDSYSLNLHWAQLTERRQRFNEEAQQALGTGATGPGRSEYALTLDANFVVGDGIVFSPFVRRTWNANRWFNGFGASQPADGFTLGFGMRVGFDRLLGLNARR